MFFMKKIILLIFVLVLLLTACAESNVESIAPHSIEPRKTESFLDVFDRSGFEYTVGEEKSSDSFFSVERQYILIGDDIISFYEYDTNEAMEADAACVDSGGCSINVPGRSVCISWVSLPHFYKKDNVIVNYVGENEQILDFLEENYGEEFAGAGKRACA